MARLVVTVSLLSALLLRPGGATRALADDEPSAEPVALTVPELIDAAAQAYGLPPWKLRALAMCESNWRPWVTSPYGDGGLFQFKASTFQVAARLAGLPPTASRYDAWDASLAAAAFIAAGHARAWPVCSRRAGLA